MNFLRMKRVQIQPENYYVCTDISRVSNFLVFEFTGVVRGALNQISYQLEF